MRHALILVISFFAMAHAVGCASAASAYNNEIILTAATKQETALAQAGAISPAAHLQLNAAEHSAAAAIASEKKAAASGAWNGFTAASAATSALDAYLNAFTAAQSPSTGANP